MASNPTPELRAEPGKRYGGACAYSRAVRPVSWQLWSPRMTEELKELGLDPGHRRIGRAFLIIHSSVATMSNKPSLCK